MIEVLDRIVGGYEKVAIEPKVFDAFVHGERYDLPLTPEGDMVLSPFVDASMAATGPKGRVEGRIFDGEHPVADIIISAQKRTLVERLRGLPVMGEVIALEPR